jgi:predicted MFS family arabinose efflux permease
MALRFPQLTTNQARLLLILALINFVNFADRTVILPLFPILRNDFSVTDQELGSLQFWLQVVLASATVPFALLADRISRRNIIAAGVIFWSLATFFSGLAGTFFWLVVARALVGLGEAAYGPAAQSMITGAFSPAARARAQAVFAAGMLVGGAAGQALGGVVGDAFGWRPAFFLVGVPGLLLGLLVLTLGEPPRGPRWEVVPVWKLLRVPAFVALILSGVFITFAAISFITWGADYVVRYKGFSVREAGISLGTVGLVALVTGVLAGGFIADRLQRRFVYGRVLTIAVAFLLAAPCILWALAADDKRLVLAAFFLASSFMSFYHGPIAAVIHDMTPTRAHATSVGVYMFVTQLLGAFGPLLLGQISDVFDLRAGLEIAVGVMVIGALGFFGVAYFIHRDGLRHPLLEFYRIELAGPPRRTG